jgi:hypothetical protein
MAPKWTPAGGGQVLSKGAVANTNIPTAISRAAVAAAAAPTPAAAAPATPGVDPAVQAAQIAANASAATDRANALANQANIDAANAAAAAQVTAQNTATMNAVQNAFAQYGLSSLFPMIQQYAMAGDSADAIAIKLRATPEYNQRFPAMAGLSAKGRAISEADYVNYERTASSLERQYGLPKGMLMGSVTGLLTNEVSATELNDRVVLAAANSLTAPKDLQDTMASFYGLNPGDALTAYYLDPSIALPLLEKQAASARIGVEAKRQGIGIDVTTAEGLQGQGVTESQAQQGFGVVKSEQSFQGGKGETATQNQLISGTFGNQDNAAKIQRIGASRVGEFTGGGGYAQDNSGNVGLGSASR